MNFQNARIVYSSMIIPPVTSALSAHGLSERFQQTSSFLNENWSFNLSMDDAAIQAANRVREKEEWS